MRVPPPPKKWSFSVAQRVKGLALSLLWLGLLLWLGTSTCLRCTRKKKKRLNEVIREDPHQLILVSLQGEAMRTQAWRHRKAISRGRGLRRHQACGHWHRQTSSFQNCEETNFWYLCHSVCSFVTAARANQYRFFVLWHVDDEEAASGVDWSVQGN